MNDRVMCIWLPYEEDWEETLGLFGREVDSSETNTPAGPVTTLEEARNRALSLLAEPTENVGRVLVRSTLAAARQRARGLGVHLNTEEGRARVAASLLEIYSKGGAKTVLGLKMAPDGIGWALMNEAGIPGRPVPAEGPVQEMFVD